MSELLTYAEYQALAKQISFPASAFIDGKFRRGSGEAFDTINPANGERLTTISACNKEDVDLAVQKARDAFDSGSWSKLHPADRKSILIKFSKLILRNARELAVLESLDSGKPVSDCVQVDIPETVNTIKWHAEATDKLYDQCSPSGDDAFGLVVREPVGVVAAVLPWNFPLLMLAWKIAPALACGNAVIVKPAEQTSMTALRIAELASEAGVPRAILQVLPGDGPSVGEPLGRHPDVDMVSFTGSTDTGRRFLHYAADSNLKKVVLECGGKNPAIVLDDAEHLDRVAEHIVNGAFWNMGENCSASSRLIVHQAIKEPLLQRIVERAREWRTGDPLDPVNQMGALIDKEHAEKVASYLEQNTGLETLLGGKMDNNYLTPTIYDKVPTDHPLATEEVFGPILSIITVASVDEAIKVANDTRYGLTASVFSANGKRAIRSAREIKAGTVTINCYGEGDITTPFGGYKQSGFGGRDNSLHAHDQYSELKTIWMDLTEYPEGESVV